MLPCGLTVALPSRRLDREPRSTCPLASPYLALATLYVRWNFLEEASAVLDVALANVATDDPTRAGLEHERDAVRTARADETVTLPGR